MNVEFNGIERRLDELNERLARLEPISKKTLADFQADPYLRDIVERNLEVAVQCCIDVCNRIIALEGLRKPKDYYEAFIILGEAGMLEVEFSARMAPLAGFRNILVHEYLGLDWTIVIQNLQRLDDLKEFGAQVRRWFSQRS